MRLKTLYQWKTKLVKLGLYRPTDQQAESVFVSVKPIQSDQHMPSCTVKLPNGTVIEFTGDLDSKVIRSVITSTGLRR